MKNTNFKKLTPKLMLQLAAPHTWPASIFPVFLALACSSAQRFELSAVRVIVLLVVSILMQSAVNAVNDYRDYKSGTDSKSDDVDPTDAVLIYNNVNPKSALYFAIGCLVVGFILGLYCIYVAGWVPLLIAAIGVVCIFLYSGEKFSISYLPLGEVISGIVMGELITFASWIVLTNTLNFIVLVWAFPLIFAIALMMMTNNTCDIEKDILAKRHTLPVMLGHKRAVKVYHALVALWYVSIILIILIWFTPGIVVAVFALIASWPLVNVLIKNPLESNTRIQAMSQVLSLEVALGLGYCASVLGSCLVITI